MFKSMKIMVAAAAITIAALPALADSESSAARDSLIAFNDTFNTHAANLDIEGLLSLYHEDAYWIAPATAPAQGRDGVPRQTVTFLSENEGELSHTIDDLFISADGTQAVMLGNTKAKVESAQFNLDGTYMYVLERLSEQDPWVIVADMFNNHATE